MDDASNTERAIELLQQLGLKEYEAKSFVALTRLPQATAKEISDISDVPRTRVYDAVRVLESKGLVEIQHANPQQFRAVSIDEAAETLRTEYESRTETLQEALRGVEPIENEDTDVTHEVWALSSAAAIASRTGELVDAADEEVVVVVGHESAISDEFLDRLAAARDRGVDLAVGTVSGEMRDRIAAAVPDAEVFVSGLEWLSSDGNDDTTEISRLLLIDRSAILVSTIRVDDNAAPVEQAVFGRGFNNGLVTIVRRLMATGLLAAADPAGEITGDVASGGTDDDA